MTDELLTAIQGNLATLTLNRPQALNALTLEMIRGVAAALKAWETQDTVQAVIFKGSGRAFCAGGDIKAAYRAGQLALQGKAELKSVVGYFAEEYLLDLQIFHYRKPLVAFMDGITMGGGYGVAGACRYRVATENTVFAMPEVGIGFFPDVGAAYYFNHCGALGKFLALTGQSIGAADMLLAGLATHFVSADKLAACEARLAETTEIAEVLADVTVSDEPDGIFVAYRDIIEECFAYPTIAEILAALRDADSEFAHATATAIFSRAPLSVLITLEHLHRAENLNFDQAMAGDFARLQHFLASHDFYEGIRAAIIDKDRQPRWQPARLADVSSSDIDAYFAPAKWQLNDFCA